MDRENSEIKTIKLIKSSECSCKESKNYDRATEISLDNYISNNVYLSYFNSEGK